VLQLSFDHFVAQPIGILANCWTGCELVLMHPIRFHLLPDVLIVARQTFVWHIFHTQNQLLLKSIKTSPLMHQKGRPGSLPASHPVRWARLILTRPRDFGVAEI
jgi:hypothetical protein